MESKFYLVSCKDKEGGVEQIIETSERPQHYDGTEFYFSISPAYESVEELREKCHIHDKKCKECGGLIKLRWVDPLPKQLKEECLCHSCHIWSSRIPLYKGKDVVVVEGMYYTISKNIGNPNRVNTMFAGHGGRLFKIKRFGSEEIIECNNLWCGGDVPEIFKDRLKDNAEFVK